MIKKLNKTYEKNQIKNYQYNFHKSGTTAKPWTTTSFSH